MLSDAPRPDLLIVGGLTVDEFADGRTAPGGSVLHAAAAVPAAGVVTVCGDEPEALAGMQQLRTALLERQPARRTIRYGHAESEGRRVLTLLERGEPLEAATVGRIRAPVVVLAPVAGELPAAALAAAVDGGAVNVALLQGWLRRLEVGQTVEPLAPSSLPRPLLDEFRRCRALVASTEDLPAAIGDPFRQAAALRSAIGPQPVLVLTLGSDGFLLDDPARPRILASVPRRVVEGVPTVGAGDIFGTVMAAGLGEGAEPLEAAERAAEAVVRVLTDRRSRPAADSRC